jgi:hypothetical protein
MAAGQLRLTFSVVLALSLLVGSAVRVRADETGYRIVDNVLIYLGVIPAAMIRGHPAGHPESLMHGGVPAGADEYHVLIALFNAKTYERISNAKVTARVSEIGLSGVEKKLEPMEIAGTTTFGNYFEMKGMGPFRIEVSVDIPGAPEEINAVFEHRHQ